MPGPVTATYQVQKDGKALISDKKTFESVTPDNPIEIAIKRSDNGTYTAIMLLSDKGKNLLHQSSTSWYGSNATFSTNRILVSPDFRILRISRRNHSLFFTGFLFYPESV